MAKKKKKQKYKKVERHNPLKVLFRDIGSGLAYLVGRKARKASRRSVKGSFQGVQGGLASLADKNARKASRRSLRGIIQDIGRGLVYLRARPIRTSLASLATIGLVVLAFFFWPSNQDKVKLHLENAKLSFEAKDYDAAIDEYETALEMGSDIEPTAYVNYIGALVGKGDEGKTREVLLRLAPGPGNPPGIKEVHRIVAISHSKSLANSKAINLRQFKWHLDHSGPADTTELNVAWARYKTAVDDFSDAVSYFQAAAADDPRYYGQVISLQGKLGRQELQEQSVREARPKIEELLNSNPNDDLARVLYSRILFHMEEYDECEQVLQTGLEMSNSQTIKDAYCKFYLQKYLQSKNSASFSESLGLLQKAFLISPESNGPIIEIEHMHRSAKSLEDKSEIEAFLETATENQETALSAHTLLATIFYRENKREDALEHAEKTYELDATSPIAANNLAFQIAESPNPDLDRALELSRFAVEKRPKNASFRDSLGTILMKMDRHKEATTELKTALALNVKNPNSVHKKLAINYDKLGFKELSQRHAAKGNRGQE